MLPNLTSLIISFLREAAGYEPVDTPFLTEEGPRLNSLLIEAGLIDHQGKLLRSLNEISLYDILLITKEGLCPVDETCKEFVIEHNYPGVYKMGVFYHMMRTLLSRINLSEL